MRNGRDRYPKVCAYRIGSLLESAKKALGKEMELKHVKNILKGDPIVSSY